MSTLYKSLFLEVHKLLVNQYVSDSVGTILPPPREGYRISGLLSSNDADRSENGVRIDKHTYFQFRNWSALIHSQRIYDPNPGLHCYCHDQRYAHEPVPSPCSGVVGSRADTRSFCPDPAAPWLDGCPCEASGACERGCLVNIVAPNYLAKAVVSWQFV